MKKLFAVMLALTMISTIFISCSKDENNSPSNSITIQGEFTIGTKTFTNPTFDLGSSADLTAYLANYSKSTYNTIVISSDGIDLGNNFLMDYDIQIYSVIPGTDISMYAYVAIYENIPAKSGLYIYSYDAKAKVTKVGDVGGYIEGTFEGDFYYDKKIPTPAPFHLKGTFKVKRIEQPIGK